MPEPTPYDDALLQLTHELDRVERDNPVLFRAMLHTFQSEWPEFERLAALLADTAGVPRSEVLALLGRRFTRAMNLPPRAGAAPGRPPGRLLRFGGSTPPRP